MIARFWSVTCQEGSGLERIGVLEIRDAQYRGGSYWELVAWSYTAEAG